MCLIYLVLEVGRKSTNIGIPIGLTIGDDDCKKWQEHSFVLVIMCVRLSQKNRSARLDESDSIQKRKLPRKYVRKVCAITAECVSCYICRLFTTGT